MPEDAKEAVGAWHAGDAPQIGALGFPMGQQADGMGGEVIW
jgi:hypothetical protein